MSQKSKAATYFKMGDYNSAISLGNFILSQNPKDQYASEVIAKSQKVLEYKANCESEYVAGHYDKAIIGIDLAMVVNPTDIYLKQGKIIFQKANALQNESGVYATLGEYQRLIKNLKALLQMNPSNANIARDMNAYAQAASYKNDALSSFKNEDYENAITQFQKVLAINPTDDDVDELIAMSKGAIRLRNLGKALFAMGRYADAEKVFVEMRSQVRFEPKIKVLSGNTALPGKTAEVTVQVGSRVLSLPQAVSVTLLGEKTLLKNIGGRAFKGSIAVPEKAKAGDNEIKVKVALANGKELSAYGDIRVASLEAVRAAAVAVEIEKEKKAAGAMKNNKQANDQLEWLF
jgi:tetratricopeptide (TPR) repeat protein